MPVAFNYKEHQSTVFTCSRILKYFSYFMIFSCLTNIFANVVFLFFMDSFSTFGWYDENSVYHTWKLDQFGLLIFAMTKIVVCIMFYKQSKQCLEIFSPIVQQYEDARNQVTQGIEMTERLSKKMAAHKLVIRKTTMWSIVISVLTVIYGGQWVKHTV